MIAVSYFINDATGLYECILPSSRRLILNVMHCNLIDVKGGQNDSA